jgi:hypothetical protein
VWQKVEVATNVTSLITFLFVNYLRVDGWEFGDEVIAVGRRLEFRINQS